jgi:predicted MPP superfamily phosphohydrolase
MTVFNSLSKTHFTRRRFLLTGACAGAGLAIYSGEIERHWIETARSEVFLLGLPRAFDGFRIAQLSDIHLDDYTEPFLLRDAVKQINRMNPDAVFLTGDFVTHGLVPKRFELGTAWQCANLLNQIQCPNRYGVLGNHDVVVGSQEVTKALTANSITMLVNEYVPIERGGARFWLAGLDDPVAGRPNPEKTIPESIRNIPDEPIVLLSHAPDYADDLLKLPSGKAVSLMLAGHSHGGQIRLPWIGPPNLPEMGRKYVEGWFRLQNLQLYVNRGLGTVVVPFRFDCPPEITLLTLRSA